MTENQMIQLRSVLDNAEHGSVKIEKIFYLHGALEMIYTLGRYRYIDKWDSEDDYTTEFERMK